MEKLEIDGYQQAQKQFHIPAVQEPDNTQHDKGSAGKNDKFHQMITNLLLRYR